MKRCSKCLEEKPKGEFYRNHKSSDGRLSACKECLKVADRIRRSEKRLELNAYMIRKRRDRKRAVIEYLGGECVRCGLSDPEYPEIYDCHHLDPEEKDADIAKLMIGSWDKLKQELDKCILLCRNCHSRVHVDLKRT